MVLLLAGPVTVGRTKELVALIVGIVKKMLEFDGNGNGGKSELDPEDSVKLVGLVTGDTLAVAFQNVVMMLYDALSDIDPEVVCGRTTSVEEIEFVVLFQLIEPELVAFGEGDGDSIDDMTGVRMMDVEFD